MSGSQDDTSNMSDTVEKVEVLIIKEETNLRQDFEASKKQLDNKRGSCAGSVLWELSRIVANM